MEQAVRLSAKRFRDYERQHRAKNTLDADLKAETNRQMAVMCEAALDAEKDAIARRRLAAYATQASISDPPDAHVEVGGQTAAAGLTAEHAWKLPYDIEVAHIRFRKGVGLDTFVNAARRWFEYARKFHTASAHPAPAPSAPGAGGLTAEELDRLEALAKAATLGPWQMSGVRTKLADPNFKNAQAHSVGPDSNGIILALYDPKTHEGFTDAKFIAAFDPPTALRLIAAARRAEPAAPAPGGGGGVQPLPMPTYAFQDDPSLRGSTAQSFVLPTPDAPTKPGQGGEGARDEAARRYPYMVPDQLCFVAGAEWVAPPADAALRSMDTAPRDGSLVLSLNRHGVPEFIAWSKANQGWHDGFCDDDGVEIPMPSAPPGWLPTPSALARSAPPSPADGAPRSLSTSDRREIAKRFGFRDAPADGAP